MEPGRRHDHALDPCRKQYPGQSEAGGACCMDNQDRARQSGGPAGNPGIVRRKALAQNPVGPGRQRSLSHCTPGHPNRRRYAYSWPEPPDVQMWLYRSNIRTIKGSFRRIVTGCL
ncbi:MAG: hypothetical protein JWN05_2743 [Arthrobacter sp.]|nr:hypothetical protein [Arthrobacter sp.]